MRYSFVLLIFLACASFTYQCQLISVVDATKRTWVSGAPGGRNGTAYSITVRAAKTKQKVEYSNLWVEEKNVPFTVEAAALEGEVLLTYNEINGEAAESTSAKSLPIEYKGEALIECLVGGKAQYLTVSSFRKLEGLKGE